MVHRSKIRAHQQQQKKGQRLRQLKDMKEKIHPKFYNDAVVMCACGNRFTTGSTKKELKDEVCSNCHPYFTGERRIMDTTGRVERFKKRYKIEG